MTNSAAAIQLKPGTYTLTRDVRNPRPDRRHKDDWSKWPIWEAGTEFLVSKRSRGLPVDDPDIATETREILRARDAYYTIRMVGVRFSVLYEVGPGNAEQYAALVEALEPCGESVDALFERLDARTDYFARWLVESGRLDRETFERVWAAYQEDGGRTAAEGLTPGRRLVEEPSGEELGVETDLDALNQAAAVS